MIDRGNADPLSFPVSEKRACKAATEAGAWPMPIFKGVSSLREPSTYMSKSSGGTQFDTKASTNERLSWPMLIAASANWTKRGPMSCLRTPCASAHGTFVDTRDLPMPMRDSCNLDSIRRMAPHDAA